MTDEEALEFCDSRIQRLKTLKKQRRHLPNNEAGYEKFCAIKEEALSICDEVEREIVEPQFKSENIAVTMKILDLMDTVMKTRDSYLLRR